MTNPQREHGHVDIANTIVDHFCKLRLSGQEWQILWVIIRKTYGWQKKSDQISLSQFSILTGIDRSNVCRALSGLIGKGVIKKTTTYITTYSFVKHYNEWKVVANSPRLENTTKTSGEIDNRVVANLTHTKDTITKDNKDKEFFDYFLLKTKKKFKLTPARAALIDKRLKTHSIDQLKQAVDAFILDTWEDRHKYMDLVYCIGTIRGVDKLEGWLNVPIKKKDRGDIDWVAYNKKEQGNV